jgi:glycosyltransferase involved in cell wall biosynthesis
MLSGTGIKNKLLEAMANELPCVVTPLALRGLSASPGRDVLVGGNEEELAHGIRTLIDDRSLAAGIGSAARSYVVSEHDWSAIARSYETLYRRLAERTAGTHAERR